SGRRGSKAGRVKAGTDLFLRRILQREEGPALLQRHGCATRGDIGRMDKEAWVSESNPCRRSRDLGARAMTSRKIASVLPESGRRMARQARSDFGRSRRARRLSQLMASCKLRTGRGPSKSNLSGGEKVSSSLASRA